MYYDNGDIYVGVIPVNKTTNSNPETARLVMYYINPKTDAVTEYMTKKQFAVASLLQRLREHIILIILLLPCLYYFLYKTSALRPKGRAFLKRSGALPFNTIR